MLKFLYGKSCWRRFRHEKDVSKSLSVLVLVLKRLCMKCANHDIRKIHLLHMICTNDITPAKTLVFREALKTVFLGKNSK